MESNAKSWAEIVGRLPAKFLVVMASLACIAFVVLLSAMADSIYRTHVPLVIAGYQFGYGAHDQTDFEKLKAAINEQFSRLSAGIVSDPAALMQNSSSMTGSGVDVDHQGRCPQGEAIVGLQAIMGPSTNIRYRCGKMPDLRIP